MSDYSDIQQELDDFKNAVYGEEVRDSMVSAIKKIHDLAESAAGAPDASSASAGQAPIADGAGGWAWSNVETGDSIPTSVRQAILALFQNGVYTRDDMSDEVAVIQSWATEITSISVSPTTLNINGMNQRTIIATTTPAGGVITWASSDETIATVSGGVVTPTGVNGSCTITASCGGKSATCAVTVSGFATLLSIEATYTQSGTVYDTYSLDSLKSDLVVTANYDDGRSVPVTDYVLQGELAEGTSTIVVAYGGKTATFTVTVTAEPVPGIAPNQAVAISGLTLASGMINDSGEVVASNNSYFIDSFVDAETVVYFKDGDIVTFTQSGLQGRSAFYDSSDTFLSRIWKDAGTCIVPVSGSSKQKIGWTAASNPDYYVIFSYADETLFVNEGLYLGTDGELASNSSYSATDFLEVGNLTKYLFTVNSKQVSATTSRLCFYDANKTMISRFGSNANTGAVYGDIPSNAVYYRMDKGNNVQAYSPFVTF